MTASTSSRFGSIPTIGAPTFGTVRPELPRGPSGKVRRLKLLDV
jgi:hypothetical protein